ncbi:MAG: hypothetical protein OXD36_15200, partial [Rhodobacter sp.]|nr:hypothetical protein [Rhodobacter sp.]
GSKEPHKKHQTKDLGIHSPGGWPVAGVISLEKKLLSFIGFKHSGRRAGIVAADNRNPTKSGT